MEHSVTVFHAVWFEYEDDRFYFWSGSGSVKARNLEQNAEASVCVATHNEPYQYVSAKGPCEIRTEDIEAVCWSICGRYFSDERARAFVAEDLLTGDSVILAMAPRTLVTESST